MKKLAPLVLAAAFAGSQAGCYGSYSAFNKVHKWNGEVTNSKVANSLIHFGMWVVPVYQICLAVDFLVLNNVEFITGEPVL